MRNALSAVWDLRASLYDFCEGSRLRRGATKAELFREMDGKVLFVAVGTGTDIRHFPEGRNILAIDISDKMLAKAAQRAKSYSGNLVLAKADVQHLHLPDAYFDTVTTSCTMCSVPQPAMALRELCRVLKPGGRLLMFEHVRSRNRLLGFTLDCMTLWTRLFGTAMNRETVANVLAAGFQISGIRSVYLDIILAIRAMKPAC